MRVFCLDFSILCFILLARLKILHLQEAGLLSVHLASSSLIVPSISSLSWAYFTAQFMMLKFTMERDCLVKTSIRNNPSILT